MLCDDLEGLMGWGVGGDGDICVLVADLHFRMAEANTVFYSSHPPIKKKLKHFKNKYMKSHQEEKANIVYPNISRVEKLSLIYSEEGCRHEQMFWL